MEGCGLNLLRKDELIMTTTQLNEKTRLELIDTEKAQYKAVENVTQFKKIATELKGAKLLHMEPTTDGLNCTKVKGVTIYFALPNGQQRAINIYAGELEPDELYVELYQ
jgi:hypothetical protein